MDEEPAADHVPLSDPARLPGVDPEIPPKSIAGLAALATLKGAAILSGLLLTVLFLGGYFGSTWAACFVIAIFAWAIIAKPA
jgi:hypothetical protein